KHPAEPFRAPAPEGGGGGAPRRGGGGPEGRPLPRGGPVHARRLRPHERVSGTGTAPAAEPPGATDAAAPGGEEAARTASAEAPGGRRGPRPDRGDPPSVPSPTLRLGRRS